MLVEGLRRTAAIAMGREQAPHIAAQSHVAQRRMSGLLSRFVDGDGVGRHVLEEVRRHWRKVLAGKEEGGEVEQVDEDLVAIAVRVFGRQVSR